jgi:hypothetical protein
MIVATGRSAGACISSGYRLFGSSTPNKATVKTGIVSEAKRQRDRREDRRDHGPT